MKKSKAASNSTPTSDHKPKEISSALDQAKAELEEIKLMKQKLLSKKLNKKEDDSSLLVPPPPSFRSRKHR